MQLAWIRFLLKHTQKIQKIKIIKKFIETKNIHSQTTKINITY